LLIVAEHSRCAGDRGAIIAWSESLPVEKGGALCQPARLTRVTWTITRVKSARNVTSILYSVNASGDL
jgi:hypothetical protein